KEPQFAKGCLFDGFPRTLPQARSLDETLAQRGTPLDLALELKADEKELIARMVRRAAAERRADDNPATVAERMDVYRKQTAPLLAYYADGKRLVTIDALGTPDEVFARIKSAIEPLRPVAAAD